MADWEDLSDDELLARLVQRGVVHQDAVFAVAHREDERLIEVINFTFLVHPDHG